LTDIKQAIKKANTYDGEGRLMSETAVFGTRSYGYDEVNNRVDMLDRNGRAIHYSIDNLNRVTTEEWINSLNSQKFTYSYDKNSNVISADDGNIKYEYSYEARDLVEKVDRLSAGQSTVSFVHKHDDVGNLTETKELVGGALEATTSYEYDDPRYYNTRVTQSGVGLADKRVDFVYSVDTGLLEEVDRYLGNQLIVKTINSYDDFGRLTGIVHENSTGVISIHGYDYDSLNRLTAESRDGVSRSFAYDKIDEVKSVSGSNTESYTYDKNGNRTNAGYQHTDQNRLTSDGVYSYDYDNEGNRTKRTELATGKVDEYTWDYRNRLTGVVSKDIYGVVTQTVSYEYDVNDLRVSKNVDGSVEKYFLDGDNIAFVTDGDGKQTFHYLYGMEADQVLAQDSETGMVWSLADRLGSIDLLTNEQGVIVDQRTYDSFGNTLSQLDPNVKFRFGYTGRESDPETGLYYYRARYFDANVGRFISTDPIGFEAGDSNLYRYVNNSSTLATDPTGEFAEWFDNAAYTADKFLAGFAHTLTGGKSTELRTALYGSTVAGQHEGFAFDVGRSIGLATGLVTVALATGGVGTFSGGLDAGSQLFQNGGDFSKINLASVAISAASGKIGSSVSSGLGKGGFLLAGTSFAEKGLGLAARTLINGGVGFNLGYWGKVAQNVTTGEDLTNGAWQSGAFGAAGAAAGELLSAGVQKSADTLLNPAALTNFDDWLSNGAKSGIRRNIGAIRANNFRNNSTVFYHASSELGADSVFRNGINIIEHGRFDADFGRGFYMTTDKSLAAWTTKRFAEVKKPSFVVFRVGNKKLDQLEKLTFSNASSEWADFVTLNKELIGNQNIFTSQINQIKWMHGGDNYDMVVGPFAKRLTSTKRYNAWELGDFKNDSQIRTTPIQVSIHTQKSIEIFQQSRRSKI
jgi:RHS repeat-associated protein